MSTSMEGSSGAGKGRTKTGPQDFDLNIAPIIDCFTVLITFMLASASFLSIGVLDAGAGSAGPQAPESQPQVAVQVELQPQFGILVKLTGKSTANIQLPPKDGKLDFEGLMGQLARIKSEWTKTDSVTLSASNDLQYRYLIETMEHIHKVMPGVVLGGF